MLKRLRFLAIVGCGIFALGLGQPASAIVISTIGQTFDINYVCDPGDSCPDAGNTNTTSFTVSAMTSWEVTALSDTSVTFDIDVSNTTDSSELARLTAFGFLIDPTQTSQSINDSGSTLDWGASQDSIPGFNSVNVCIFNGQNCQGGGPPAGSLQSGQSDSLLLTLGFDPDSQLALNLTTFAVKFQSVGSQGISLEFGGDPNGGGPPTGIPEPHMLLLLGIGLLGLGYGSRRRPLGH